MPFTEEDVEFLSLMHISTVEPIYNTLGAPDEIAVLRQRCAELEAQNEAMQKYCETCEHRTHKRPISERLWDWAVAGFVLLVILATIREALS